MIVANLKGAEAPVHFIFDNEHHFSRILIPYASFHPPVSIDRVVSVHLFRGHVVHGFVRD